MKKNMLIRIVSLLCVVACLFAFASCHEDLATKEELNNAATTNKTDLTEAQKALYEAMDAVKATADAAATKAALEEVKATLENVSGTAATKEALEKALATIAEVKATADAAATQTALDELKATLEAAIEAVKTTADAAATQAALEAAIAAADKANTDLKTELDAKIEANKTLIGTKVTELQAAIDAVKATADAAATKEALDAAVADITADLEAVKTTADAAATKTALDAVIADLAAVKTTADAAATQTALDAVIADLAAVKGTSDAAATKDALDAAIAEINAVKSTYATKAELAEVSALLDAVKATADAAATKTALEDASKALSAALATVNGNTEAINTIKESLKTLATAENIAAVNAELANVKAIAEAAQTADEVAAAINAAIANLKLDDKITAAKTELNTSISALDTKLAANIKANADEIAALKTEIANLKLSVGDKTEVTNLATKVANLEEALAAINADAFAHNYRIVTQILLGTLDYESLTDAEKETYKDYANYTLHKFLEATWDVEDGAYSPATVAQYKRVVDEIKFSLSRAVTFADVVEAFNKLNEATNNLETLEACLKRQIAAITVIKLETEKAMAEATETYKIMEKLGTQFEDKNVEKEYLNKKAAYDYLVELREEADNKIDKVLAQIIKDNEVLLSEDGKSIQTARETIENIVVSIMNVDKITDKGWFELYTNDIYEATKAIVAEELYNTFYGANKADYIKAENDAFWKKAYDEKYAVEHVTQLAAKLEELALKYMQDHPEVTDIKVAEKAVYDEAEDAATLLAQGAAKAHADTQLAAEAAKLEEAALAKLDTAAKKYRDDNLINSTNRRVSEIVAETLYNKDATKGVFMRYDLLIMAQNDAIANLYDDLMEVANDWAGKGWRPLYNDKNIPALYDKYIKWMTDAKYKDTVNSYGEFTACTKEIEFKNAEYILGGMNKEYSLSDFISANTYVGAMNDLYKSYITTGKLVDKLKAELNGDIAIDDVADKGVINNLSKTLAELDKKIEGTKGYIKGVDGNKDAMVSDAIRDRLDKVKKAYAAILKLIEELKKEFWVTNYDEPSTEAKENITGYYIKPESQGFAAGADISAFEAAIKAVYETVLADDDKTTNDDNITAVSSKVAQDNIDAINAAYLEFSQIAAEAYKDAKDAIEKIEKTHNGKVTLDLGDEIYDAINKLNAASDYYGLLPSSIFKLKNAKGEWEDVSFFDLSEQFADYGERYKTLAAEAEAVAATIRQLIKDNKIANLDAKNLNNYKAIVNNVWDVFVETWIKEFFDVAAKDMTPATFAKLVEENDEVNVIGQAAGFYYAFLTKAEYDVFAGKYATAAATYNEAKALADAWKTAVNELLKETFNIHLKDRFDQLAEDYDTIAAYYYVIKTVADPEDPNKTIDVKESNLGSANQLFAEYTLYSKAKDGFAARYEDCNTKVTAATGARDELVALIAALGGLDKVTVANYEIIRANIANDITPKMKSFLATYCNQTIHAPGCDVKSLFSVAYEGAPELNYYVLYTSYIALFDLIDFGKTEATDAGNTVGDDYITSKLSQITQRLAAQKYISGVEQAIVYYMDMFGTQLTTDAVAGEYTKPEAGYTYDLPDYIPEADEL